MSLGICITKIVNRHIAKGLQYRAFFCRIQFIKSFIAGIFIITRWRGADAVITPGNGTVGIVMTFDKILLESVCYIYLGIIIAILYKGDIHSEIFGTNPNLFHSHLFGYRSGRPMDLGHCDSACLNHGVTGCHIIGIGGIGNGRCLNRPVISLPGSCLDKNITSGL